MRTWIRFGAVAPLALLLLATGCAGNKKDDAGLDDEAARAARAAQDAELRTDKGTGTMGEGQTVEMLKPVYFDFDKATIREGEKAKIKAVAEHLKQAENQSFRLRMEGHADDRGSADYNLVLGERRAHAVRDALQAYGIEPTRLETVSYGEEFPVVQGTGEESYALNRRVEFVLLTQ